MKAANYIKSNMATVREINREYPRFISAEEYADEQLITYAGMVMKEKLEKARQKGRGGWWDETICSVETLRQMLKEHVDKGDMADVLNLAAMVLARECADEMEAEG